jgi:hypothetical protein
MEEPWGNHEGTLNLVLIGTCITNQFIWECVIAIKANWRSFKDPHNRGNDLSIMILVSPILKAFFRIPNCECASKVGFSFDHIKLPLLGVLGCFFDHTKSPALRCYNHYSHKSLLTIQEALATNFHKSIINCSFFKNQFKLELCIKLLYI